LKKNELLPAYRARLRIPGEGEKDSGANVKTIPGRWRKRFRAEGEQRFRREGERFSPEPGMAFAFPGMF